MYSHWLHDCLHGQLTNKFAKTLLVPDEWSLLYGFDKLQKLCCHLIHLMWMQLTRMFVTLSEKQPKKPSHAIIKTTIFCVGMQSLNFSTRCSCSLLREMTQVWLLQLYLPNLTGSRRINGPKQFRASTFYILVIEHAVY